MCIRDRLITVLVRVKGGRSRSTAYAARVCVIRPAPGIRIAAYAHEAWRRSAGANRDALIAYPILILIEKIARRAGPIAHPAPINTIRCARWEHIRRFRNESVGRFTCLDGDRRVTATITILVCIEKLRHADLRLIAGRPSNHGERGPNSDQKCS